jgi:sodium transport system permease protein
MMAQTNRKPKWLIVYAKELKETLRDRRALSLLALFVLMYPCVLAFILHNAIDRATRPEREGIALVVIGGGQAPTLIAKLKQKNVTIDARAAMTEEQIGALLRARKAVAVLRLSDKFSENYQAMRPALIEFWYDSAADTRQKQDDVKAVLRAYSVNIAGARLLAHGVSPATLTPIQLQQYDTGTSASRSASLIGALLGSFFLPAFIFCQSSAVDSSAGERERRSLEVLLAQPARAVDIIAGKWLAAATLSIVGVTLELLVAHCILKWLPLEEIGMSWQMSLGQLLAVCLVSIPLSLFAAAFEIALAMNARSFKEAQSTVALAMILPLIPIAVVPMLELNTANWMYLAPVLANKTLLGELAKGQNIGVLPFALTAGSGLLFALAAVAFASWRLKSERYVATV